MAELDARRSEVLGKSASIVQRKFLTYSARKKFNSLKFSSIQIQAMCRGTYLYVKVYEIDIISYNT